MGYKKLIMLWTLFVRCPQPPDLITEVFHESGGNQRWNVGADDERVSERDGSNIGKRQTRKAVGSEHLVTEQNAHLSDVKQVQVSSYMIALLQ